MYTRKTWFIIGALGVFVAVLIVGTDILLRRIPPVTEHTDTLPPPGDQRSSPPTDGNTHFINAIPSDPRMVTYTATGFSVPVITIRARDAIGCAMTITNTTNISVTFGIGPHNAKGKDPGFPYQPVMPGETAVLDVRYAGISSVTLHDHARPQFELTIRYGEGCRAD